MTARHPRSGASRAKELAAERRRQRREERAARIMALLRDRAELEEHLVADDGWTAEEIAGVRRLSNDELEELHDRAHAEGSAR